jgi:hypothetical protein
VVAIFLKGDGPHALTDGYLVSHCLALLPAAAAPAAGTDSC